MGEMANPTPADRAITRADAIQIVYSVENDEKMPLPFEWPENKHHDCPDCPVSDVEEFAARFAQEITLLADQLDFLGEVAMRLIRDAAPNDNSLLKLLAEMYDAAREHKVPDWWPAFRDERNARSKHG